MTAQFDYDVFLSHNSADKPRVRQLAERLKAAGLRVWFDEWSIAPGEDIYLAIERGLETSRTLVLFLSSAALSSNWVSLERSTVLFRDPTNSERRFLPVLLEDCTLPDTLRRYRYIDFRSDSDEAFAQLLAACHGAPLPASAWPKRSKPKPLALLSLGGFLAALLLLWLFGAKADLLVRPPEESFSLTVFVHGEDGAPFQGEGSVLLDLGQDRRRELIDHRGQASFKEIPRKFLDQEVPIQVEAKGFEPVRPSRRQRLSEPTLYLAVKRQAVVLRGWVQDSESQPIAEANVNLHGLTTTSGTDGSFLFKIPGHLLEESLVLSVSKAGYKSWKIDLEPLSNSPVAVLERSAQ